MVEYQPGACNIGEAERRRRYGLGAVGLSGALVVVYVVLSGVGPRWLLLTTVVPLFGAALGYVQGHAGFCVNYGLRGVYDATDDLGRVTEEDARAADRRRSLEVVGYAAAAAVGGALVIYGLGLLAT
jgi:hypothetical protein